MRLNMGMNQPQGGNRRGALNRDQRQEFRQIRADQGRGAAREFRQGIINEQGMGQQPVNYQPKPNQGFDGSQELYAGVGQPPKPDQGFHSLIAENYPLIMQGVGQSPMPNRLQDPHILPNQGFDGSMAAGIIGGVPNNMRDMLNNLAGAGQQMPQQMGSRMMPQISQFASGFGRSPAPTQRSAQPGAGLMQALSKGGRGY